MEQLSGEILKGWNTWDNRDVLTHVLLEDGVALDLSIVDESTGQSMNIAFTGNQVKGTETVRTIAHSPDGVLHIAALRLGSFRLFGGDGVRRA